MKNIINHKLQILNWLGKNYNIKTSIDFGGIWNVDGFYTKHMHETYSLNKSTIVDRFWPSDLKEKLDLIGIECADCLFSDFDFENKSYDVCILFDVLLHQVIPDWRNFLGRISKHCEFIVIYNPQWLRRTSCRLTDLDDRQYFMEIPHEPCEDPYNYYTNNRQGKCSYAGVQIKDSFRLWQWGITNLDLINAMHNYGFQLIYLKNYFGWTQLKNFQNYGFIFKHV